jgi:hypothetical protein
MPSSHRQVSTGWVILESKQAGKRFLQIAGGLLLLLAGGTDAAMLDLSRATVVAPRDLSGPGRKAVTMLLEEVEKRTQIRWPAAETWPRANQPLIVVGPFSAIRAFGKDLKNGPSNDSDAEKPEGYSIRMGTDAGRPIVWVGGSDERGVLFGVGRLLRALHMETGRVLLEDSFRAGSAPKYPLRGHQLGYRPKTHSYDAWDLSVWEQYIRDLAVFGCNAIELIPPRSDDDATSPHFPLPPMPMMKGMSRLLADYGLDVWIWYPAMDKDYSDPKTVDFALQEWATVFKELPRIDALFVPGGDPGHTQPKYLMALLEKQTLSLHRWHPRAQMWVSPQSFNQEWLDEFIAILRNEQPTWLSGVVFGPQVRVSLPKLRALVPAKYPIRHYPDITHSRQCQYPVPDWDTAFAVTEGREGINPRPAQMASIFRLLQPDTIGFITYSEGCNDDVNKTIWSALGWDPDSNVSEILRDYSRYFISQKFADGFAQGLLALERNWHGPLLANESVYTTLQQFQAMERAASKQEQLNWRFQEALYRAYYDACLRRRLVYETGLEDRALQSLREAQSHGSLRAMADAETILERALKDPVASDWRAHIFELGEALFQSIRMQLSVPLYKAIGVDRGANLDTIDYPLNNRSWLKERFATIRRLPSEAERLKEIDAVLDWTNPGPGGFYDDPGNVANQPHLVPGLEYYKDPAFLASPHAGFEEGVEADDKPDGIPRYSWLNHAESMNDEPLLFRYTHLDSSAQYRLRVVYGGDSPKRRIRLASANGIEIHPFLTKPRPIRPVEFDVPPGAIVRGELVLNWFREPGLGGNGRGCQVSEIWLIRKQ